jgi:hypothetical protein
LDSVLILADTMPKFIVDACKFMRTHKYVKNVDDRYAQALRTVPNGAIFAKNAYVKWSVLSVL